MKGTHYTIDVNNDAEVDSLDDFFRKYGDLAIEMNCFLQLSMKRLQSKEQEAPIGCSNSPEAL